MRPSYRQGKVPKACKPSQYDDGLALRSDPYRPPASRHTPAVSRSAIAPKP